MVTVTKWEYEADKKLPPTAPVYWRHSEQDRWELSMYQDVPVSFKPDMRVATPEGIEEDVLEVNIELPQMFMEERVIIGGETIPMRFVRDKNFFYGQHIVFFSSQPTAVKQYLKEVTDVFCRNLNKNVVPMLPLQPRGAMSYWRGGDTGYWLHTTGHVDSAGVMHMFNPDEQTSVKGVVIDLEVIKE